MRWIKWAPWHKYRGAEDADGEVPEGVPVEETQQEQSSGSGDRRVYVEVGKRYLEIST